jgi:hypothetical protein
VGSVLVLKELFDLSDAQTAEAVTPLQLGAHLRTRTEPVANDSHYPSPYPLSTACHLPERFREARIDGRAPPGVLSGYCL